MEILKYLQPENPIALGLTWVLMALFAIWILKLFYMWFSLEYYRGAIRRGKDIGELADKLVEFLNKKESPGKKSLEGNSPGGNPNPGESESAHDEEDDRESLEFMESDGNQEEQNPVPVPQSPESAFASFLDIHGIKEKNIIAKHIKAVYDAGLNDSRLDVGELIKHTNNVLFRGNTFLKTLLGSFIVIGLLGTLLGLTDSLAALSPVLGKANAGESSRELSMGLSNLFLHLKTAFAPSIWGVGFTVVGLLFFSFYIRAACFPVKKILEQVTLTVWVPRLFLTTSQRLLDTLRVSEEQVQKNLAAIQGVVDMQETIKTDVGELSQKLKSTNKALASMTDSASELNKFTLGFGQAVSNLTSYQGEIKTLYQQMTDNSKMLKENLIESSENSKSFQTNARELFENQNTQLAEMYKSLKNYEGAYLKDREKIDLNLQAVLEAAQGAYKSLAERNKEVIKEMSKPVTEQLGGIEGSLETGLDAIEKRFGTFDAPIKKASEKIEGALETVVMRMETLTQELQREFVKLNETINGNLTGLIKGVETQSSQLSAGTKTQAEVSEIMKEKVTALSDNIASLNKSVETLNESSTAGRNVLSQMGQLGEFGNKVGSLVETLERGNRTQETQIRELIRGLEESSKKQDKRTGDLVKEIGFMGKKIDRHMRKPSTVPGRSGMDFPPSANPDGNPIPYPMPMAKKNSFWDITLSPVLNFFKRAFRR